MLDAKLEAENFLLQQSSKFGFEVVIIRPGRLIGEPFTNFDLAKLFQLNKGEKQGIQVSKADVLNGDVERIDVATAVNTIFSNPAIKNKKRIFSIINIDGKSPTNSEWQSLLKNI